MSTLEPSGQIRKEEHGMDGFGIGKEHSDLLSDFRTKEKEKGERGELCWPYLLHFYLDQ